MSDGFSYSSYIISKSKLIHNVKTIRSYLKQGTKLCAVVKSDAYGVGAKQVAKIIEPLVEEFAVANLKEGILLRKVIKDKPIIVLPPTNINKLVYYSKYNLTAVVSSLTDANYITQKAISPIDIQIKVDSGMHRFGFDYCEDMIKSVEMLKSNSQINIVGIYSHLATKENNVEYMIKQLGKFSSFISQMPLENKDKIDIHISNSNALLLHPDFNFTMVRSGFALYGMENKYGLKPVVEIKSKLVNIKMVKKGEYIGYNQTYIAPNDMKIGIVPLGYADGLNRKLSNKGCVIVNGNRCKIIGNICMDVAMIDITHVKNVHLLNDVTIIGEDNGESITLDEIATIVGTSDYDVLVGFKTQRMKRKIKN